MRNEAGKGQTMMMSLFLFSFLQPNNKRLSAEIRCVQTEIKNYAEQFETCRVRRLLIVRDERFHWPELNVVNLCGFPLKGPTLDLNGHF